MELPSRWVGVDAERGLRSCSAPPRRRPMPLSWPRMPRPLPDGPVIHWFGCTTSTPKSPPPMPALPAPVPFPPSAGDGGGSRRVVGEPLWRAHVLRESHHRHRGRGPAGAGEAPPHLGGGLLHGTEASRCRSARLLCSGRCCGLTPSMNPASFPLQEEFLENLATAAASLQRVLPQVLHHISGKWYHEL